MVGGSAASLDRGPAHQAGFWLKLRHKPWIAGLGRQHPRSRTLGNLVSKHTDVFGSLLTSTDIQVQPQSMTERHRHCHLSGLSPPPGLPLPSLPLGLPYPSDVCPLAVPRLISLRPLPTTFMPTPLCPLIVPHRRHRHPRAWGSIKATMKKWAASPGVRMEMAQLVMIARSQHRPKMKNTKSMHSGTRAEILPTMLAWYQCQRERAQNGAAKTKNTKNLRLGMTVETIMLSWCWCQ